MKKIWFLVVFSVILAAVLISTPVLATSTAEYTVSGIEIFAGINVGKYTLGATFVTQGNCSSGVLADTNGILSASVNYIGPGPQYPTNIIIGGNWTLTITTRGKVGTIFGKIITPSTITWTSDGSYLTSSGHAVMDLSITGGTGAYKTIKTGSGTFTGTDNHESNIKIGSITVPTVWGTLDLNY